MSKIAYKYWVATILVVSLFMEFLDSTIVNVAMPTFARQFNASAAEIQWVATVYLLALAMFVLVSGWAGDRFGSRRVFMTAVGLFTLGSYLCGMAWSLSTLVAFRALQGVGAGMMSPVASAMMMRAFPVQERAQASGWLMVPSLIGPVTAPFLGGYLVQYHGWSWIFWVNLPFGVMALWLAKVVLREDPPVAVGRLDWLGFVTSSLGLAGLLWALSDFGTQARLDAATLCIGVLSTGSLLVFVLWQRRSAAPLIDLSVFTDVMFCTGAFLQLLLVGVLSGCLFALTLCLQDALGYGPFAAGAVTAVQALGCILLMPLAGHFAPRWGAQRTVLFGVALATACVGATCLDVVLRHRGLLIAILFLRGVGFGCCLSLTWAGAFNHISERQMGRASGVMSALIQLGAAFGVASAAVGVAILRGDAGRGTVAPYELVSGGFAAVGLGCWVLSWWHRAPAATREPDVAAQTSA